MVIRSRSIKAVVFSLCAMVLLASAAVSASAQANKRKNTAKVRPTSSPTPPAEPMIISRAEDFPVDGVVPVRSKNDDAPADARVGDESESPSVTELRERIKRLENGKSDDPDEKQRRLSLNIDILTKAEQRSDSLRKQLFEMIEKENSIRSKVDQIDNDLRPESLERNFATVGSLRPEELRAQRKRSLELERQNLQSLLVEVQKNRTNLELNLTRSDALVELLRTKLEKEVYKALEVDPVDKP